MGKTTPTLYVAGVAAVLMVLAGCSAGDDADTSEPDSTVADAPQDTESGDESPGDAGAGEGDGSLVLTIGDESWEFDNLICATGLDANESDTWAFAAYAETDDDSGTRLVVSLGIGDDSGAGRLEGEGVYSYIEFASYANFTSWADVEEPTSGWSAETDLGWDDNTAELSIDGSSVTGSGDFVAEAEFGVGAPTTPGTLTGTCGAGSVS